MTPGPNEHATQIGIGIIGCGVISDAYLKNAEKFPVLRMIAVADINDEAARAKAEMYGIEAMSVEALLLDPRIGIVLNLTTPQHHVPVGLKVLESGKHVYSEKPLATTLADGLKLMAEADKRGLRVGCAPDTFLGASHQTSRRIVDDGTIGPVVAGTAFMQVAGHELWHPNPDFYYQAGGGPLFDMGPYYLTCLINLLGPVRSVVGAAKASYPSRTIGSGPRKGESFKVGVATHIAGLIDFENGAAISLTTSFDVWKHGHNPIELYGTNGSMVVSDPNRFEGDILVSEGQGNWVTASQTHPYGDGNYRILGLADMAQTIKSGRDHRANLSLSLHVLEIMEAILESAENGHRTVMKHRCERPAPMRSDLPFGILE